MQRVGIRCFFNPWIPDPTHFYESVLLGLEYLMACKLTQIFFCTCSKRLTNLNFVKCTATSGLLKGLSHEIDFKNFDKNLQNLA